jgi:hypothetical protein
MSTSSTRAFSGRFDILQIIFDQWGHFRGLPVCLFGLLGPGKGKVPNFSRLPGLLKNLKAGK